MFRRQRAQAAGRFQAVHHESQGLVRALFVLPQAAHRFRLTRVAGQLKAAQALEGQQPAGLEQIRGGADGRLGGCRSGPAGKQGRGRAPGLPVRPGHKPEPGAAVRAGYGLGVEAPVQGSAYSAAQRGQSGKQAMLVTARS